VGRVNGENEGGWTCIKNRTMKTVEIVLRRGKGVWERMMDGVNLTKIHYKHVCMQMWQWNPLLQLIHAFKKV
jgi:hypothetical protein